MIPFVEISQQLVGKKYSLGECDCFRVVLMFFDIVGVGYPKEFKGVTVSNYKDLFLSDPISAKELMIDFLDSFIESIRPAYYISGDILLLQREGFLPFLAIAAGNGTIISASEQFGVGTTPIKFYKTKRAWRCLKQSR